MSNLTLTDRLKQDQEVEDYVHANLRSVINTYVWNHVKGQKNDKLWSCCDMMFTEFLISSNAQFLYKFLVGGHDLYMHHLQAWFRALSRDEALIPRDSLDVQRRVRDAERILEELTEFRQDAKNLTPFDTLVCQMDNYCNKKYKLFCLCLTFIVQRDCEDLYKDLMEWHNTVTCGWFDSVNTDDARAFVARAEIFFQRNVDGSLLKKYAGLRHTSRDLKPDLSGMRPLQTDACATGPVFFSMTKNPYAVSLVTSFDTSFDLNLPLNSTLNPPVEGRYRAGTRTNPGTARGERHQHNENMRLPGLEPGHGERGKTPTQ
jgi:hypothetical protein